jgi:ubiquinone/menaquinone biosynthesis C-methylase UbiE
MSESIVDVFDRASGTYDSVGVDFFTPMGAALVEAVSLQPGEKVLDVGCGRGAVLFPAAAAVGPTGSVTGIDLAPGMVSRTEAQAAPFSWVDVRLGDAQAPDFPDGSFDVITAGLVLFFLPDPRAALTAYGKLLRPGGRLAFTCFAEHDPRYPETMKILARHAEGAPAPRRNDDLFQTAASTTAATRAAGFETISVRDVTVDSSFKDAEQLFDWVGSHAGRQLVQHIPRSGRDAAIAEVASAMGAPIAFHTRLRIVLAS